MTAPFNSEFDWLLFHLWVKPSVFRFRIAETVVLNPQADHLLSNWYFTAKEGHILKKNRCNVSTRNIVSKFANKLNTNFQHAAATAYHYDLSSQDQQALTLEHIATHDFSNFMFLISDNGGRMGSFKIPQVIQKFVYSKSSKNQVFKLTWQAALHPDDHEVFRIERAFNIYSMYDSKVNLNDRVMTFEAEGAKLSKYSQKSSRTLKAVTSVCSIDLEVPQAIEADLRQSLGEIRVHLDQKCKIQLTQGTFYFKYDKNDHLFMTLAAGLRACSLSTNSPLQQEPALAMVNLTGLHPMLLSIKSQPAPSKVHKLPNFFPEQPTMDEEFELGRKDDLVQFLPDIASSYQGAPSILKHPNTTSQQLETFGGKICPFCSTQRPELSHQLTVNFVQSTLGNLPMASNEDCAEVVSPTKPPGFEVAEGLKRAFPQLKESRRALRLMQDPQFIYQAVRMCEECYRSLTSMKAKPEFHHSTYLSSIQTKGVRIQKDEDPYSLEKIDRIDKLGEVHNSLVATRGDVINETERENETLISQHNYHPSDEEVKIMSEGKDTNGPRDAYSIQEGKLFDLQSGSNSVEVPKKKKARPQSSKFPILPKQGLPPAFPVQVGSLVEQMKQSYFMEKQRSAKNLAQPCQSQLKQQRPDMSLTSNASKPSRPSDVNSYFKVNTKFQQQLYQNKDHSQKRKRVSHWQQKKVSTQLSQGQSSIANLNSKMDSDEEIEAVPYQNIFQQKVKRIRPQSGRVQQSFPLNESNYQLSIQVGSNVGERSMRKLRDQIDRKGMKVEFLHSQSGEKENKAKRPASGKPPPQGSVLKEVMGLKPEFTRGNSKIGSQLVQQYGKNLKHKVETCKQEVFAILDEQLESSPINSQQVESQQVYHEIQNIQKDIETAKDIEPNFLRTEQTSVAVESTRSKEPSQKAQKFGMYLQRQPVAKVNKQRQALGKSSTLREDKGPALSRQKQAYRMKLVNGQAKVKTLNTLPPRVPSAQRPMTFNPSSINLGDIEQIAENADSLIQMIANIKSTVKGRDSQLNEDIRDVKGVNSPHQDDADPDSRLEGKIPSFSAERPEVQDTSSPDVSPQKPQPQKTAPHDKAPSDPDLGDSAVFQAQKQRLGGDSSSDDGDLQFAMLGQQVKKSESWW